MPSLAQLAAYRADWDARAAAPPRRAPSSPSARAWSGKLCLPYALRGLLRWREGELGRGRACSTAARTSWPSRWAGPRSRSPRCSASAARCATGATTPAPATALDRALDVCERAGLIAQSIQAIAARADAGAGGQGEQAAEAAEEATELAERLHYPVGRAAALEAAGFATGEVEQLAAAREAWLEIGRPLDAARCALLAGRLQLETDPDTAASALEEVAAEFDRLGVPQLSQRARELLAI